ncbi:MAG: hypothetical protein RJA32_1260 [Pseudomonadota bacterium]|mgnify:CR=1 FL=1|jgi:hypothetical protein
MSLLLFFTSKTTNTHPFEGVGVYFTSRTADYDLAGAFLGPK